MNAALAMSSDEVRTADRGTLVTDASAALLRTIAEGLDIRDVFPRVSAIVKDVLPHNALEPVFHDRTARAALAARAAVDLPDPDGGPEAGREPFYSGRRLRRSENHSI